ncbi:hypothetical protein HMPREF0322_04144 [Desulfitobacterium hafniense DP7]|uniref:Uncharacterized protein n=1 Tax=Desulfitobacterium hafniense DP7 TaxID=537010 RepID=G9XT38_DESHA|nr:hypothetical protein HMPREF0322_04144 [Desulfitobacterium hafniense DP7]
MFRYRLYIAKIMPTCQIGDIRHSLSGLLRPLYPFPFPAITFVYTGQ